MNYGFDKGKFYVEQSPCSRDSYDLKKECELRAVDLYSKYQNLTLCLSSGLDSQVVLHSFKSQSIPINCVFMYLEGYNDKEYEQIKILEKKYNFLCEVIKFNQIEKYKEELEHIALTTDTNIYHALHYKFVEKFPKDSKIILGIGDPWIVTDWKNNKDYYLFWYYDGYISRIRCLNHFKSHSVEIFSDSNELQLSLLNDDVVKQFLFAKKYYKGNKIVNRGQELHDVYRFDFYIKPTLYAKYWNDNLEYFPKFMGFENIQWIRDSLQTYKKEKTCFIPYKEVITNYKDRGMNPTRYYEKSWIELITEENK